MESVPVLGEAVQTACGLGAVLPTRAIENVVSSRPRTKESCGSSVTPAQQQLTLVYGCGRGANCAQFDGQVHSLKLYQPPPMALSRSESSELTSPYSSAPGSCH